MPKRTPAGKPIPDDGALTIKVTLEGLRPPIWRRLSIPANLTLEDLHWAIQVAMGWTNSHLHQFMLFSGQKMSKQELGDMIRADPDSDPDFDVALAHGERYFSDPEFQMDDTENERQFTLPQLLGHHPRERLTYTYDMGDSWQHEIRVEGATDPEPGTLSVRCLAGERAGPPDDSGGPWGYADLLDALADEDHEGHDDAVDWLGDDFDPEKFDLDEVNKQLKKTFKPWPKKRGPKPK
ncbi:MAG TPA: plasmid pRiA4b ORF-3 family protein [Tepidisphaeraceae bacterium]|jgi:hypothetical protein